MCSVEGGEGDGHAVFESHIRDHGRFYHRLAYGVLRSAESAADVCQQAFLKAWEHRARIRQQGAIKGWLTRVIINESYCCLRRAKTEQRTLGERTRPSAEGTGPAELLERRELVAAALAQLPEPIREVVILRTMQGLSGNEVSRLLETNASVVSRRLHEGLDLLRQCLDDIRS